MEKARSCRSQRKDSSVRLSRSVHVSPSAEPWSTQPVGALAWSEEVSVYCTALVSPVTGSSTVDTVAPVAEVLSNSSPSPFRASLRGVGTLSSLVIDTGAAFLPEPHDEGREPMSNSRTPPRASTECGSDVEFQRLPLTFRPCT